MAGYGVAIKNSFLNLVPPRGTDWRFKSPPHPIHTRWQQLGSSVDNDVKDEKGFQAIAKI
jgi:hypothetical protein